jgi:hypothetical protein
LRVPAVMAASPMVMFLKRYMSRLSYSLSRRCAGVEKRLLISLRVRSREGFLWNVASFGVTLLSSSNSGRKLARVWLATISCNSR